MNLRDCLFSFSLYADLLFFGVASIVGYTFEGSESSPIYKIYMAAMGGIVIGTVILYAMRGKIQLSISLWILLVMLPTFVIASYFWQTGGYLLDTSRMAQNVQYMLCFSYTGCCAGIYVANQGLAHFVKYFDLAMVIMTISLAYATASSITGISNVGGASYQTMSYMAGFTFCLNLCLILWGKQYERFSLFKGEKWNIVAYLMLTVQLLACLISGGRGGFVLLALGSAYMLYRSRNLGKMLILCIVGVIIAFASSSLFDTELFAKLQNSTARTFNYLDSDTEHVIEVSGRSDIVEHTINIIKEDNFMGRGLFRSIQEFYPHNFLLEVLEQGGILYLLFWVVALIAITRNINKMINQEHLEIILPLALYPAVFLMLSGTYTYNTLFWFVISFVWTKCELDSKTILAK